MFDIRKIKIREKKIYIPYSHYVFFFTDVTFAPMLISRMLIETSVTLLSFPGER